MAKEDSTTPDLTSEAVGCDFMRQSTSEEDWNRRLGQIKASCGGYPEWWYGAVVSSGLITQVAEQWGGSGQIEVVGLRAPTNPPPSES